MSLVTILTNVDSGCLAFPQLCERYIRSYRAVSSRRFVGFILTLFILSCSGSSSVLAQCPPLSLVPRDRHFRCEIKTVSRTRCRTRPNFIARDTRVCLLFATLTETETCVRASHIHNSSIGVLRDYATIYVLPKNTTIF